MWAYVEQCDRSSQQSWAKQRLHLETIQGKEALEADEVFARVDKGLKVQVKGL